MRNSHLALVIGIALLLAGCGGSGGGGGAFGDDVENLDGAFGGDTIGNLVGTPTAPPGSDLFGNPNTGTGGDFGGGNDGDNDLGMGGDDTASGGGDLATGHNGDTEPAGGEDGTSDSSVTPELLADWQTGDAELECGQAGGYDSWYKIDTGKDDGSWELGGIAVDLAVDPEDGSLSWWATGAIGAVIVKGGTGAHAYVYEGGADADSGLTPPGNLSTGLPFGISHVTFCWSPEEAVAQ